MSEPKTKPTKASVAAFLNAIEDPERRKDCKAVARMMKAVTGAAPKMWGPSMVGYGSYQYRYASGHKGEWFLAGFAPRKSDLTVYIMAGFKGREALMKKLGKHKTGKSCLYIKRLADIDEKVLKKLVTESVKHMKTAHG